VIQKLGGGDVDVIPNATRHLTENTLDSMKRKLVTGTKTVLVIRAQQTTGTDLNLRDDIFLDTVNLARQIYSCSWKKLKLIPYTASPVGPTGVLTVGIPSTIVIPGSKFNYIENVINGLAMIALGIPSSSNLNSLPNYVMLCIPLGTIDPLTLSAGWQTYGYVNHWLSVYNDDYCRSVSAQLSSFGM
jgi:hypothetical protein